MYSIDFKYCDVYYEYINQHLNSPENSLVAGILSDCFRSTCL